MDLGLGEKLALVGVAVRGLGLAAACRFVMEGANATICDNMKGYLRQQREGFIKPHRKQR